jgi:hypothetical protein
MAFQCFPFTVINNNLFADTKAISTEKPEKKSTPKQSQTPKKKSVEKLTATPKATPVNKYSSSPIPNNNVEKITAQVTPLSAEEEKNSKETPPSLSTIEPSGNSSLKTSVNQTEIFADKTYQIEFEYPKSFKARSDLETGILVALTPLEGGFPTLTATIHPGRFRLQSLKAHEENVIRSYHLVGITDAQTVTTFLITPTDGSTNYPASEIRYSYNAQLLRSLVVYITAPNHHFIFTWVDKEENFETSKKLAFDSINSVRVITENHEYTTVYYNLSTLIFLFTVLIGLIIAVAFLKVYHKKKEA